MIARVAAVGAVVLAAVALAVVLFGGGTAHRYVVLFDNAGQLVKDDDVQVGGRRIGAVEDIELTADNRAQITVSVQEPYAPLHEGTTAIIRATSLSGVANRYLALTPGPQSNPRLNDGATLGTDHTTTIVDLDALLDTFDAKTRADLQRVVRSLGTQYAGRGEDAGQAAKYFNPLLTSSRRLVQAVGADDAVLARFLVDTSATTQALAARRGDLTGAVTNTNRFASALAAESSSLDRALALLPTTLRRGNTTFVNLRTTLDALQRLVDVSKPATRRLAPFLRALRPLASQARPTIADLRLAVTRPGPDNDLVDVTLRLPRLERTARGALRNSTRALQRAQPVLEFYRPYTPDLVGWFRDFGQVSSNYDANGHYARIAPVSNLFRFQGGGARDGGTLTLAQPGQRLAALEQGRLERCPGAAVQVQPDGSNDRAAGLPRGSCNPGQVPPGP